MAEHFADRLLAAIERKGSPVCVGLDPVLDRLPEALRRKFATFTGEAGRVAAVRSFCLEVLELVAPYVPAVKPQSAYFEVFGSAGVAAYEACVARAHELGLVVIGDVKRNDIGSTAAAYAEGHLKVGAASCPDAVTVNGYLGSDGIKPFIEQATSAGKGLFVLVRTSNPSARELQDLATQDGRKVYEHMASLVASLGASSVGACGYSHVGAVVGATVPDEARALRDLMPQQIVLVPGYGAQGGTADDAAVSFKPDGTGGIVNASRSVIFAHTEKQYAGMDWKKAVESAAKAFASDIAAAVKRRKP
ncbi:MAG: orotidine-5'-phosphate decarboxylase [Phycisphaerae bacterium]|nr:orotidine-5'-phosphate decarboxylase [Phycisphaerae bacterium]